MYKKPSNEQFGRIFDKYANIYDRASNKYSVDQRIKFIKKYSRGRCLEVGAGTGEISKALVKDHEVVAVDISPNMVRQIIKKIKIKARVADAEHLPFRDSSFNTIIGAEMIYYLNNPANFTKEANRVLEKGGGLLITSARKITFVYDIVRRIMRSVGIKSTYFDDKNIYFIDDRYLRKLLINAGFRILKEEKRILIPFKSLDWLNSLLEKTFFNNLSSFIYIYAKKIS